MRTETLKDVQLVLMDGKEIQAIKEYAELNVDIIADREIIEIKYKCPERRAFTADRFIIKRGVDIIRAGRLPYPVALAHGKGIKLQITIDMHETLGG